MKRISLACVAISLLVLSPLRAVEDIDAMLQKFFPDRDLTRTPVKIVDHAHGIYIVADSMDVMTNGAIRTTNTAIAYRISQPDEAPAFIYFEGLRMLLTYVEPIKSLKDLKGNKLRVIGKVGQAEPNNRMD